MTLNEKIGVILKQHKEGEEFFNALDFMIKGDRSILEDFLSFFMNDAGKKLNLGDTGLIVSGGFGNAIMTMYGDRLTENFGEVIVTNGGIRLGNEAAIFKDRGAHRICGSRRDRAPGFDCAAENADAGGSG